MALKNTQALAKGKGLARDQRPQSGVLCARNASELLETRVERGGDHAPLLQADVPISRAPLLVLDNHRASDPGAPLGLELNLNRNGRGHHRVLELAGGVVRTIWQGASAQSLHQ